MPVVLPGFSNDRRHDSSRELPSRQSPATALPLPKEVRPVIGVEVTRPHTITLLTMEARTRLLILQFLIRELAVLPGVRKL
ncbi:hypothetical protein AVEN_102611-1 [Araneus ventricosus]|uniref:Uncharacterized protein n=1 Tax=Araneus ventricosus TaxID=182803 RepID=A0A4Y2BLK2_ARAVE|nr:hypothetical protein AVEN_102611-1 [Araneus ventricosus]